jgi:alpha-L-fucosidase
MIPKPAKTPGDTAWWTHARFGMFIHWGLYAAAGRHEWVKHKERIPDEEYQKYFDHFDPDLFDPAAWAREAKGAGMRYMVVTSKHHEGFCLWDSKYTDYKATNTPAKRDVLRPMLDAFRAEGLRVGVYHSLIDWHHPEFPVDFIHPMRDDEEFKQRESKRDVAKYAEYLHNQVRELLEGYGPLDILWFDFSYSDRPGGKGKKEWQSEKLIEMVRELAPGILINDRTEIPQDFVTPEQVQPTGWVERDGKPVLWEACQTFNVTWGYGRDYMDWKPVDMLVKMLIDNVANGGNLLLNVGPTARGEFEPKALERLRGIGEWMRLHERSIRGCTMSEYKAPPDCRLTQNGKRLYVHVFSWPSFALRFDDLPIERVEYAQLLNDGSEIRFEAAGVEGAEPGLTFRLPTQKPPVAVPVIEVFLR